MQFLDMPKDTYQDNQSNEMLSSLDGAARAHAAAYFTFLIADCGYTSPRLMAPDKYACLMPLLFTTAIITGQIGDRVGHGDRWCYRDPETARRALDAWDGLGEPDGWHRHHSTGRRRSIEADKTLDEWIDP